MNFPTKKNTLSAGIANTLVITGFFMIGLSLAFLIVPIPLLYIYNIPFEAESLAGFLQTQALMNNEQGRIILLYIQGLTAIIGFMVTPWLYLKLFAGESLSHLNPNKNLSFISIFMTIIITILIMPFTSWVIELNTQMHFPGFLSHLEDWALSKEIQLQELTVYLTQFSNINELFLGLIIIALIPALGEEFLFRGLLQRNFQSFMNPHIAVWLSAILFSAFHLQFFGFIPRMLLGALFGYLYLWSGNLWVAIIAHFVNNAFTLIMRYLYNKSLISFDIFETKSMSFYPVLISLLLTCISLYYFRKVTIRYDLNLSYKKR